MKHVLLLVLSFNCYASSGYPQFKYKDIVESTIPGTQKHNFYSCVDQGKILDFKDRGLKNCSFDYLVEFNCNYLMTIKEWRCDKYLKRLKK